MPRKAILAKSVWLTKFSGLAARPAGTASGRVFGHAIATCLIGGGTASQLGGTDSAPIEEARPKPAGNTRVAPLPAPRSAERGEAEAPVPEPPETAAKRSNMTSVLPAPTVSWCAAYANPEYEPAVPVDVMAVDVDATARFTGLSKLSNCAAAGNGSASP